MKFVKYALIVIIHLILVSISNCQVTLPATTQTEHVQTHENKKTLLNNFKNKVQVQNNPDDTSSVIKNFTIIDYSDINVRDRFYVAVNVTITGVLKYALNSSSGEQIFQVSQTMNKGLNEFEIDLNEEAPGKYSVVFIHGIQEEKITIYRIN